jgi:hypothetical protein
MIRFVSRANRVAAMVALLLLVAGCGRQEGGGSPRGSVTRTTAPATNAPVDSISRSDSASAARAVAWIQDYYRAINEHRYHDAYAHWERGGMASGKTFDEFRKGFDETERVEVDFAGGTSRIEGAAGSRYIELPVQIAARTRDGKAQEYSGLYRLRLSVVDGATPEQRSWHIYSAHVWPTKRR